MLYTTSQALHSYATSYCQSSGTVYDLTLLDRQTDVQRICSAKSYDTECDQHLRMIPQNVWDDIHDGMYQGSPRRTISLMALVSRLAGKTGTAEVDGVYHPNHGMFIGYAPCYRSTVCHMLSVSQNGYSSGNACLALLMIFSNIFSSWQMNRIDSYRCCCQ